MKTEIMTEDWMVDVPRATPATIPVPESAPFAPTEGERLRARQLGRIEAWAEDLKAFFGAKAERLVSCSLTFALGDYLMAQRAIAALLPDWRIEREAAYDRFRPERPAILERRVVKTGPRSYDYAIAEGRQFWVGPQGTRLVIGLKLNEDRKEPSSDMTFFVPADGYDWLNGLIRRMSPWMDRNHVMRGKVINALGEFIECKEPTRWEDVLLPETTRRTIERNCIGLLKHADLFRANHVPLRRGIILHGPPGTGKTLIGQALAQHCGVTFILATPGMLEEPEDVRRVFVWGRRFAPSILFFEDFDMVARDRYSTSRSELVGEFLTCLDGIDSAEGVITIATTNNLQAIEPALRDRPNRFDCILEIPPMARPERMKFIARIAERHGGGADCAKVADMTEGFTGAQMQEVCRLAVFEAIHERLMDEGAEALLLPLTDEHFIRAVAKIPRKNKRRIGFVPEGGRSPHSENADEEGDDDDD